MKNGIWEIVPRPEDKSVVTSKWLYKIKHATYGSIDKYTARFMARGFSQQDGIDYDETFAPTTRYTTIHLLVSLAASMGWNIHQMDVKTAFLNRTMDEEVCIEQPLGFEAKDRKAYVCRLKRHCMASSKNQGHGVEGRIEECKKQLAGEFDMKDLGLMHYYSALKVWQEPDEIYLGQGKYVIKMLKKFDMMDCKPITPMITNLKRLRNYESSPMDPTKYRQLIGSLMYLVNT
eukprot:PITA_32310